MKRIGEGQGACLHPEKRRKRRDTVEMSTLWRGHWLRPYRTKFVRCIYLFDYKIKYIALPSFENNPFQYLECFLNTEISGCANC